MKAVQIVAVGRPVADREVGEPAIGTRDVLVRVGAAGICHSDAHYRNGTAPVARLPLTPGHEIAGTSAAVGSEVAGFAPGDRVCVHYLATCGECPECRRGREQFCPAGRMLGKDRDGGYAELVGVPARSVFPLPAEVPLEWGAVLMCSSATSLHALRKARFAAGESVAVFGAGGLGASAVQIAAALGAAEVFAVDLDAEKLALAARHGARPVNAAATDPVAEIRARTGGRGVDVALELVGLPLTMSQAVRCLAIQGRAALAGITDRPFEVSSYRELIGTEAEIIGVSDHLAAEIPALVELVCRRRLDLGPVIARTVPLAAAPIDAVLDRLERFGGEVRTVVVP
ncbi:MAG: zinc-binding dehydrogenase [Planctomycetota bacterium]